MKINKIAVIFSMLCVAHHSAFPAELFKDRAPVEFAKDSFLESGSTTGGYPIYEGDGTWRLSSVTSSMTGALGGATEVPRGDVKLLQIEPNGDWFASQFLSTNLAQVGTNQYATGSPCSGEHLVAVSKPGGQDDNCMTIDANSFQSRSRTITFFTVRVTQTRSGGRKYLMSLLLNADLLGFRETTPGDWTRENVQHAPSRKAFVEKLEKWAGLLQEGSARAIAYDKPKNAFDNVPSFRTLQSASSDRAVGTVISETKEQ